MTKNTIKSKITLFFGLFLVILLLLFMIAQIVHEHSRKGNFFHHIRHSAPSMIELAERQTKSGSTTAILDGIELRWDKDMIVKLKDFPQTHDRPPSPPPQMQDINITVKPMSLDDKPVLLLTHNNFSCIAIDTTSDKVTIAIWSLFLSILTGSAILYWLIIKSLRPLETLRASIERFGNGDLLVDSQIKSDDEIGQIAKAFDSAVKQIRGLLDSKDIFLKNAAHELRTPITKGVITTHLLAESRDKEILLNVFKRLETISESVLSVEHFSNKDFELNLEPIIPTTIIDEAIELLFLDPAQVLVNNLDTPILADSKLMLIVFKNLIDNGIKFADNGHLIVESNNGKIIFRNLGVKLEEPCERYFDPFFKETSIRNAKGSGLGLFLAKKISNAHGLSLSYEHRDGYNCFVLS